MPSCRFVDQSDQIKYLRRVGSLLSIASVESSFPSNHTQSDAHHQINRNTKKYAYTNGAKTPIVATHPKSFPTNLRR
jgi:hypothetical protein